MEVEAGGFVKVGDVELEYLFEDGAAESSLAQLGSDWFGTLWIGFL